MGEVEKLRNMLAIAKELTASPEPCLEGDMERIIGIVISKLRLLDPENTIEFLIDYE